MSAGMIGADVEALRRMAFQFDQSAHRLRSVAGEVSNGIRASAWVGPVSIRFQASWDSEHSVKLKSAAAMLEENARLLRQNAHEQDAASAAGTGTLIAKQYSPGGENHSGMASPGGANELYRTIRDTEGSDDGVRIQAIQGDDGEVRYIVYLDGTRGVGPDSFDPNNNRTWWDNAVGIEGDNGRTEAYILEKMKEANIPPGSDIMMVGYSQGGIHAQNIASNGDYHITDVVTFGSPIVPNASAQIFGANVVSLRDPRDPVPYTDLLGHQFRPDGAARGLYSILHPDTNGEVKTFESVSTTVGRPDEVHTERGTYESIGSQYDQSTDPQFAAVKESQSRYHGTVISDTNDE